MRIAAGLAGLLLLALMIGLATRWIDLTGTRGPMNVQGAEGALRTFVQAIHDGDSQGFSKLFVDELGASVSLVDFVGRMTGTEALRRLNEYEDLDVCEFQFGDQSMLTARGVLYHDHGTSLFVSTMSQGNEGSWRVHDFKIPAVVEPELAARCRSEAR